MHFRRFSYIPIVAALVTLAVASAGCQEPRDTVDVLLVGNSYTASNDLAGLVPFYDAALAGPRPYELTG